MKIQSLTILTLGLLLTFNVRAQIPSNVSEIKDSCRKFTYKEDNYDSDHSDLEKFINILNLDVLSYYDMNEGYPTQLSILNYKKTQDYLDKKNELISLKNDLKNNIYYYDIPFNCSEYDLKNKRFVYNEHTGGWYYSNAFIQYENLLITRPSQINLKYWKCPFESCQDELYYSFKITDLATAEKIEKARLRIMYLLNFKETKTKWVDNGLYRLDNTYLIGNLSKVIIYNSETGEVLHTIKYTPLVSNPPKKKK